MISCAIVLLITTASTKAQTNIIPEVGKPMPEFTLTDVHYFAKKKVSLNDFKGKWLILDCWNRYCGVCLRAMPKINKLQDKFKDRVRFIMVGYNGSQYTKKSDDKAIRKLFEMNRKNENLKLSIAYDSLLFHRFDIWPTPYIIVIDPSGVVKGITYKLTEENINDLIEGKQVSLAKAYRFTERKKMIEEREAKSNAVLIDSIK